MDFISPSTAIKEFTFAIEDRLATDQSHAQELQLEAALVDERKWKDSRQERYKGYLGRGPSASNQDELYDLNVKLKELSALVKQFEGFIPKDVAANSSSSTAPLADFALMTEAVKSKWETRSQVNKFAKAREYLCRIGTTVDSHSNALKMLPSSNDYASIFCGALNVVIKASSNYERISECFCRAMIEINDAVSAVHEEVWAYRDEFIIQKLVVRLYCQIFSFLINVIRWYTDKWHKRLLRSLNENVYDDYKEQVQDIRNLSDLIHRQTTTRRLAEIQASKLILDNENIGFLTRLRERDDHARRMEEEGYFERLRIKLEHSLRDTLEKTVSNVQQSVVDRLLSNVASQIAGAAAMKQLEQGFPMLNMVALRPEPHSAETLICEQPSSTSISSPTTDDGRITRDAILSSSARLDDFYDYQNTLPSFESLDAFLLADPSVAARMEAFTMSSHSDILHVCGPMEFFEETHSALVSARFATAARASKVPTVSYFCRLSRKTPPPWRTGETIELVGATYALIRQLVELLPNEGVQEFALSDADFGALEGTLDTWDIALKMLNRLLREVVAYQPLLYVIIDGINLLDDVSHGSTDRPLRGLVSLLQGCAEEGGRHLMKMLFTTAGESRALNSAWDSRNTVKSCM